MNNPELTNREKQVKELVLLGYTNGEIAKKLIISVHTAKAHVTNILMKFNVKNRIQIAFYEINNLKDQINYLTQKQNNKEVSNEQNKF